MLTTNIACMYVTTGTFASLSVTHLRPANMQLLEELAGQPDSSIYGGAADIFIPLNDDATRTLEQAHACIELQHIVSTLRNSRIALLHISNNAPRSPAFITFKREWNLEE